MSLAPPLQQEVHALYSEHLPWLQGCAPEVAPHLQISGVFPLQDGDRILETLPTVLPMQVMQCTRYWVTVAAAAK